MSMATRLFSAANDCFGKPKVYGLWPMITDTFEALIWDRFNSMYGPLNEKQREIVMSHVEVCLGAAKDAPNPVASFRFRMNAAITDAALNARVAMAADRHDPVELPAELQGMPFDE